MISAVRADAFVERAAAALPLTVRKAGMHDIRPILDLINGYAAKGIMLPRTEFEFPKPSATSPWSTAGGELLGCGALHFYSPTAGRDPLPGRARAGQDARRGPQAGGGAGAGSAGLRAGRRLRLHLCGRVLPQGGLSTRSSAARCRSRPGRTACAARSSRPATKSPCCASAARPLGRGTAWQPGASDDASVPAGRPVCIQIPIPPLRLRRTIPPK